MRNDLISRMALMEEIEHSFILPILKMNLRPEHEAVLKIREIIMNMPTAFDKEKVIKELRSPDNYTVVAGKHFTTVDRSVEIVEKGWIE